MIADYSALYIFFRFINSSIIFIFFYYLFKKYIYPWAQSLVQSRITEVSLLLEERSNVQSRRSVLEADIKRQKSYTQHVYELVENWNEKISERISKHSEEKNTIDRLAQDYMLKRSHAVAQNALIRTITPVVLKDLQDRLEVSFKQGTLGEAFVSEIICYFESQKDIH